MTATSGTIAQWAAQGMLNHLTGNAAPIIQSATPSAPNPGQVWINTTGATGTPVSVYHWNGSSWVSGTAGRYLALLTADPTVGPATTIAGLTEVVTAGYSRASVTLAAATSAVPAVSNNSGTITWGPMSEDMLEAAVYVAMVDVASGTSGNYLYAWPLTEPQQVSVSQFIQVATSYLILAQG